jgi:putative ABC transport system permease protein
VVENFHFSSLHAKVEPLVLAMNIEIPFSGAHNVNIGSSATPKLFIKLRENQVENGLQQIKKAWEGTFPSVPFEYEFIEDNLRAQYESERNLGKVVTNASMLAITVGCLGLFGLSILSFSSRLKEISIRKVLGASGSTIYFMLSRKFIFLSVIALVFSIPITYFTMINWLNEFEYKIAIGPAIFLGAGLLSIGISLLTVSYQGFIAIRTNPATTLRNE